MPDGKTLAYTSITAMLEHEENPINVTRTHWSLLKRKEGDKFIYKGIEVVHLAALSIQDVKKRSSV